MIVSVPCSAAGVPPLTGASRTEPPFDLIASATSRIARAVPLVISISTLPLENPFRIPVFPKTASFNSRSAGRIVMIASAAWATSLGDFRTSAPMAPSSCAGSRLRWKVVYSLWPPPSTRLAMGRPIAPKPTNPTFIYSAQLCSMIAEHSDPHGRSWLLALLHFLITLQTDIIEELHRSLGHLLGVLTRDNNHAVAVRHNHISRTDKHTAQVDRAIYRFNFIAARAEAASFSFVIGGNF